MAAGSCGNHPDPGAPARRLDPYARPMPESPSAGSGPLPTVPVTRSRSSDTAVLVVVCLAQFMVVLDISIVNVALPAIQQDLHFSYGGPAVGGDRLLPHVRRSAPARGTPGRPVRTAADLPVRPGAVHRVQPPRGVRHQPGHPHRGAVSPGGGGSCAVAGHPHHPHRDIPRPTVPGQGLRRVERGGGRRRGGRRPVRRVPHPVPVLEVDPLRERPDRDRPVRGGPGASRGDHAPRDPASAWTSPVRSPSPVPCSCWSTPSPTPTRCRGPGHRPWWSWPPRPCCWSPS